MVDMSRKTVLVVLLVVSLLATGCNLPTSFTPTALPSATPISTNTPVPTVSLAVATASATPANTATLAPSATGTAPAVVSATPAPQGYTFIDDRSTPSQVIVSFFNAINAHEYARAWGYWRNPTDSLGTFDAFVAGYSDVVSVELAFGQITGDAGAGQMYYTVPVLLKATKADSSQAHYAACYVVHLAQPGNFGEPPIDPMAITRGGAETVDLSASDDSVLATACTGYPAGGNPVATGGTSLDIGADNYLDDRSDPVATISSLLNALNRKEYVRAYSYFDHPDTFPGAYDAYASGFANTASIRVTFAAVTADGAAGSVFYTVPLVERVTTTTNTQQTFAGCYTVRHTQPGNYSEPPVPPMGITAGQFTQADNNADLDTLLAMADASCAH
jgi:hypothetical protein